MTPHGCDLLDSSEFSPTAEDLLAIVTRVQELWPEAVVETDASPPVPIGSVTLGFIPKGPLREVFIYRTRAACELWEAHGWTEEGDRELIHVIATNTSLTLVCGDSVPVEMSLWASRLADDLKTLAASRQSPSA